MNLLDSDELPISLCSSEHASDTLANWKGLVWVANCHVSVLFAGIFAGRQIAIQKKLLPVFLEPVVTT